MKLKDIEEAHFKLLQFRNNHLSSYETKEKKFKKNNFYFNLFIYSWTVNNIGIWLTAMGLGQVNNNI